MLLSVLKTNDLFIPERAPVPEFGPGRYFAPDCSPESPEAKKCPPTQPPGPAFSTAPA